MLVVSPCQYKKDCYPILLVNPCQYKEIDT